MRVSRLAAPLMAVAAIVTSLSPAVAQAAPHRLTDADIRAIYADGHISPAERVALESRPDAEEYDVDPSQTEYGEIGSKPTLISGSGVTAVYERKADRYIIYKNALRNKLIEYHMVVTWRYDGKKDIGAPVRSHYFVKSSLAVGSSDKGLVTNTSAANPTWTSIDVTLQGHFVFCVLKYGCLNDYYPFTEFWLYPDGTYGIKQKS